MGFEILIESEVLIKCLQFHEAMLSSASPHGRLGYKEDARGVCISAGPRALSFPDGTQHFFVCRPCLRLYGMCGPWNELPPNIIPKCVNIRKKDGATCGLIMVWDSSEDYWCPSAALARDTSKQTPYVEEVFESADTSGLILDAALKSTALTGVAHLNLPRRFSL